MASRVEELLRAKGLLPVEKTEPAPVAEPHAGTLLSRVGGEAIFKFASRIRKSDGLSEVEHVLQNMDAENQGIWLAKTFALANESLASDLVAAGFSLLAVVDAFDRAKDSL